MPGASGKRSKAWYRSNQFFGIVMTVLLLVLFYYIYGSSWARSVQPDRFTLGFFPLLGVAWMLLAAVLMTFDSVRREESGEFREFSRNGFIWVSGILLGWYLFTEAMVLIGFFPAGFVFMCMLLRVAGMNNWRATAATGAVCVIVVFGLFRAIGIVLPMGEIWS